MSTLLPFRDKRLSPTPMGASTYHHDPLVHVERQSKHIQNNLQILIDAQSEGLLSGLARAEPDNTSDGSFTPTSSRASQARSPSNKSARTSPTKNIGLRAARQGIFQSIYDLLKLREEEREILSAQTDERDSALQELESFTSRRDGLEEAISIIHTDRENQRAKELQEEAHHLETDIHELETRLYEMKAKHRYLVSEISNLKNSVDAKLSSYNESLSLLESNIRNYLRNPPVQPLSRTINSSFYSLNPERRTLEIAQDNWISEREDLHRRRQEVDAEILALEEGGGVWKQAMADISGFEERLRANMRHYIELQEQAADPNHRQAKDTTEEVAAKVAEDLDKTTQRLEAHLEHAEAKSWNLLVCCIAAELEAFREARKLLLPAFGLPILGDEATSDQSRSPTRASHDKLSQEDQDQLENDDPEPPADLLRDGHHTDTSRSEDDEPDPAWLLPES
ncbi:hypothetical protein N7523_010840 [Penicillium sp. IBT 18751x]|nr:hypothetical protein N7523_010840 [Penicillium sp. IBT 18751x]